MDFWQHFLQSYDQPMIAVGVMGAIISVICIFQAADQRNDHNFDDIRYQIAAKRTKYSFAGLGAAALLFGTGWAIPNPAPTFKSAYEDCLPETRDISNEIKAGCLKVAERVMAEENKKPS